jgi:sulfonate transport system substrate-binding protein
VGEIGAFPQLKALLHDSGQDQGFTYTVDYSLFPRLAPALIQAQEGGSVDLGWMADTVPLFGQAANNRIKIIAAERPLSPSSPVALIVPTDSPIHTVADLKGKKILYTDHTIMEYVLLKALLSAGLSWSDVDHVTLTPADALKAFDSGAVGAWSAKDPELSLETVPGKARILTTGTGITADQWYEVASEQALANPAKKAAIKDFVERLARAELWRNSHLDAWSSNYAGLSGLPPEVAKAVVARNLLQFVPVTPDIVAQQQKQADELAAIGALPKLDVTGEFDSSVNPTLPAGPGR